MYKTEILQMLICRDDENKVKYTELETLQLSICTDDESKVNYTELKYCRCEYADTKTEK